MSNNEGSFALLLKSWRILESVIDLITMLSHVEPDKNDIWSKQIFILMYHCLYWNLGFVNICVIYLHDIHFLILSFVNIGVWIRIN